MSRTPNHQARWERKRVRPLVLCLDYPGFRVEATTITDAWLVVLESDNGIARVRWRRAITGEDRYLAIGQGRTTLDVLGDRALLTQDTGLRTDGRRVLFSS